MADRFTTREKKLLNDIDFSQKICIEIGPAYNPILPKAAGFNVLTVDHCSSEELVEKYSNIPGVDTNKIEEVDFVWKSGSLSKLIGKENYFDYAVASHLIEHIPNPIRWMQDISQMLKEGGNFALAIPDKEFCFDFSRPTTTTGQWLQAFSENRDRHQPSTIYDSLAYYVHMNGKIYAWGQMDDGKLSFKSDIDDIYNEYIVSCQQSEYADFHFSVFTPDSFQLIIAELNYFGLIDFVIEKIYPPQGCEFIVILKKSSVKISRDGVLSIRNQFLQNMPQSYPKIIHCLVNSQIMMFRVLRRIARFIKRRLKIK